VWIRENSPSPPEFPVKQIFREPLLQFLLIGAVLFGLYRLPFSDSVSATNNRIAIGAGEIEQLRAMFLKQRLRPPTEEELRGLIDAHVHEEVLYREALVMGLDRDDTIVKRRLAQKLEFLTEDLSDAGSPTDAQLAAFFAEHGERYQTPSGLSFVHVYFSTEKRGQRAEQDAKNGLARLQKGTPATAVDEMGDMFLLDYAYKDVAPEEIGKVFGQSFAKELVKLPQREWHGPIVSGYGLHLVNVGERRTSPAATLDAVREQVKRDWLETQRRQIKEETFKKLRERYEIVIDEKAVREPVIAQSDGSEARGQ
jgi:parvulin-like peptidyl-prolyl isomerase